ncbi:MAG: hypothetical protein ACFFDN_32385, partial [Candidatus Hodarchaeota archaeon]
MNKFLDESSILKVILVISIGILSLCIIYNYFYEDSDYVTDLHKEDKIIPLLSMDPPEEGTYQPYLDFWNDLDELNASNWGYNEWREHIVFKTFGFNEENLSDVIKNDSLYENNIHISTLYVWGNYNESLSELEAANLKNQIIHDTVKIDSFYFSKLDDEELRLFINISVKSTSSVKYAADNLKVYLRSEDSGGNWYSISGDHYVKIFDEFGLNFLDINRTDPHPQIHTVGPLILNTNTIENDVSIKAIVEYYTNDIMKFETTKTDNFDIIDDDIETPVINSVSIINSPIYDGYDYIEFEITAQDDSGISELFIDLNGTKYYANAGEYNISIPNPKTTGIYDYTVVAVDGDDDRVKDQLNTTLSSSFSVVDDDLDDPIINSVTIINSPIFDAYDYIEFEISTQDASGIAELYIELDGTKYYANAGEYNISVPNPRNLGVYNYTVVAVDGDMDRSGDQSSNSTSSSFYILDDDEDAPVINSVTIVNFPIYDEYDYIEFEISVQDASGIAELYIELDGTKYYANAGEYNISVPNPRNLGVYNYTVVAVDGDMDRSGDQSSNSTSSSFTVLDDDEDAPVI